MTEHPVLKGYLIALAVWWAATISLRALFSWLFLCESESKESRPTPADDDTPAEP